MNCYQCPIPILQLLIFSNSTFPMTNKSNSTFKLTDLAKLANGLSYIFNSPQAVLALGRQAVLALPPPERSTPRRKKGFIMKIGKASSTFTAASFLRRLAVRKPIRPPCLSTTTLTCGVFATGRRHAGARPLRFAGFGRQLGCRLLCSLLDAGGRSGGASHG